MSESEMDPHTARLWEREATLAASERMLAISKKAQLTMEEGLLAARIAGTIVNKLLLQMLRSAGVRDWAQLFRVALASIDVMRELVSETQRSNQAIGSELSYQIACEELAKIKEEEGNHGT